MARAAVVSHLIANNGTIRVYGLPQPSDEAHEVYHEVLRDRLERFPQPPEYHQGFLRPLPEGINRNYVKQLSWSHALRHDAESAFWLLVWWAVHISSLRQP